MAYDSLLKELKCEIVPGLRTSAGLARKNNAEKGELTYIHLRLTPIMAEAFAHFLSIGLGEEKTDEKHAGA